VLRALAREGIEPQIISGCSIGAFVGAVAAAGDLEKLGSWVETLGWQDVVGLMDMGLRGGLIKGDKLIGFFERNFVDRDFTACCTASAASPPISRAATKSGCAKAASRPPCAPPSRCPASSPRLAGRPPARRWRPRQSGAGVPGPGHGRRHRHRRRPQLGRRRCRLAHTARVEAPAETRQRLVASCCPASGATARLPPTQGEPEGLPSMLTVMQSSISIMSVRIARSRLAGEPADVLISPRLAQLGLMDYHRGAEAIAEGEAAVELALPSIRRALGR
jgi:NTE family protein